jgi:hypothetical protein
MTNETNDDVMTSNNMLPHREFREAIAELKNKIVLLEKRVAELEMK